MKRYKRRALALFGILIALNLGVWGVTLLSFQQYPLLLGLVTVAYGFGLRHAVDADHIAAIDNTTRKLMLDGNKAVSVGFFFSLGHSTIVILLSILVAFSSSYVATNLAAFKETGSVIGITVSGFFLLLIGIINLLAFIEIIKVWKKVKKGNKYDDKTLQEHVSNRGFLTRLLKPFLKTVNKSWHMYPIGLLFGLGFDTASEVGLLSISAVTGASGMPIGYILLLPLAFTAGMTLVDSINGVLMLSAYGWAYIKPIRKLYYNMCITFISVIIALFIGGVEVMQMISLKSGVDIGIFQLVNNLEFTNVGFITIGVFIASWIISIFIYKIKRYDLLEKTK